MARALGAQGWEIVARNVRHIGFELDLVACKGKTLAIVEVKARRSPVRSSAAFAMLLPWPKRQALRRGAAIFLSRWPRGKALPRTIRFDLAIVKIDAAGCPESIDYHCNMIEDFR